MCVAARCVSDFPLSTCRSTVLARIGHADTSLVARAILRPGIAQSIGAERAFIGRAYKTLMAAGPWRWIAQCIGSESALERGGHKMLMAADPRGWIYADAASCLGRVGHGDEALGSRWHRRQSSHQHASEDFCRDRVHVSSLPVSRRRSFENHGLSHQFPQGGGGQSSLPSSAGSPPSAAMFWQIDCSTQKRAR